MDAKLIPNEPVVDAKWDFSALARNKAIDLDQFESKRVYFEQERDW